MLKRAANNNVRANTYGMRIRLFAAGKVDLPAVDGNVIREHTGTKAAFKPDAMTDE